MNKIRLKKIVWLLAGIVLVPLSGYAQSTSSPYSLFGIGEVDMGNYGENSGMAGLGIGFRQENTLNNANPASLTSIMEKTFIFDGSVFGKFSRYQGQGKKHWESNGNIQRIAIGFRAAKNWMMSVGLVPYSSMGYKIEIYSPIEGSTLTSKSTFSGEGGLNKIYWSNAVRLSRNFSAGVNSSVIFGTMTHVETDNLWYIQDQSRGQKIHFDFGLQYVGNLNTNTRLTIGAVGGYEAKMDMHNTRLAYDADNNLVTDQVKVTTQQVLPEFYGIGFTINRRNRVVGGIDYRFQKWSRMGSTGTSVKYKDMHKLSAGVSYIPSMFAGRKYWQLIKYQAGVTVNDSYLKMGGDNPVNYAATLGAVFPMRNSNMLNFAVEYGKTGMTGNRNAVLENYVKFTFGFSFKEAWFLKMRYE